MRRNQDVLIARTVTPIHGLRYLFTHVDTHSHTVTFVHAHCDLFTRAVLLTQHCADGQEGCRHCKEAERCAA